LRLQAFDDLGCFHECRGEGLVVVLPLPESEVHRTEAPSSNAKTAALRWHGRLELEAPTLTLAESQFALAALVALCDGNRDAIGVLRRLLRKARPTLLPRVG
jgi:hypothetical protein